MMKNAVVYVLLALLVSGCTHDKPRAVQPTITSVQEHRCGTGHIKIGMTKEDVVKQVLGHPPVDTGRQPYQANVSPSELQRRDSFGLIFGASEHGASGFLNVYFTDGKVSQLEVILQRTNK